MLYKTRIKILAWIVSSIFHFLDIPVTGGALLSSVVPTTTCVETMGNGINHDIYILCHLSLHTYFVRHTSCNKEEQPHPKRTACHKECEEYNFHIRTRRRSEGSRSLSRRRSRQGSHHHGFIRTSSSILNFASLVSQTKRAETGWALAAFTRGERGWTDVTTTSRHSTGGNRGLQPGRYFIRERGAQIENSTFEN